MSVADQITRINNNIAAAYDACDGKGATMPVTENSDNLADTVASIPQGGGGAVEEKDANFYDYDGELVYSYTKAEVLALSALPALPTHEGLTAQSWTHTLAELKTFAVSSRPFIDVGATYITDDGDTRLYFDVESDNEQVSIQLSITITQPMTLDINWDDGSSIETIVASQTISHTFDCSTLKRFIVKMSPNGSGKYEISFFTNLPAYGGYLFISRLECGNNLSNLYLENFTNIKYITLSENSITTLQDSSFRSCSRLIACVLPTGCLTVGPTCFANCESLKKVIFPESVTSVGNYCFQNCFVLRSLTIPNGVTEIKQNSILQCYSMEKLSLPSITLIDNNGIQNNVNLDFVLPDTVQAINTYGVSNNGLHIVDIPYGVSQIAERAFSNNKCLTKVTIPHSVTAIGNYAFQTCSTLPYIKIPNSVNSIGTAAFSSCSRLIVIDLTEYIDPLNIPTLVNYNAFPDLYGMIIYVANQTMLDAFKSATNWSRLEPYYRVKGA